MVTKADNNGSGSSIDKKGIAGAYRFGIGEKNEFSVGLYHLDNNNGMNYGMPWIKPTAASPTSATTMLPLDPKAYYGMASDYNAGQATYATLGHIPPSEFIPIAEESDLIVSLGDWVLAHACALLAQPVFGQRQLRLSVNLSARQFRQPGFVPQKCRAVIRTYAADVKSRASGATLIDT